MTRSTRRPDVCLVSMPLVALERPSLSLGILKAAGERDGLTVRCLNSAFAFAERLGLELYYRLADSPPNLSLGDWLFAGAAFPEAASDQVGYLDQIDARLLASWLRILNPQPEPPSMIFKYSMTIQPAARKLLPG